ncbi:alpha/beta hydrolase [Labedella phragmitis]|uniref:Alpha/beta hydrolase n=1 Tax=Labedella phragmitis TaxID=2498849 RepID=A0A3S3Z8K4_9MICO|nr:alpha/beta hydrolase [Labedella phragmitis]RWZ51140.1 alpha/beta hydrolase [Labedella phragmitis]
MSASDPLPPADVVLPSAAIPRPPVDPGLAALLVALPPMAVLDAETLPLVRPYSSAPVEPLLANRDVSRREITVSADDGHELALTVISRRDDDAQSSSRTPNRCVYWLHGGGMVMGDRFAQLDVPLEWQDDLGVVVATIEYRLAPEVRGSTIVEDAYAGLRWLSGHAAELGIDPSGIVVAGMSAGGGIAAGVTLLARDRDEVHVAAQVLACPMLDHRNASLSSRQFSGPGIWSREANTFAWSSLLDGIPTDEITEYVSPALARDLSNLPPTYIDAGSAEVFRDEDVAYAAGIWASGGRADLHVWDGGVHGFDALFADATISREARRSRIAWLRRVLDI